MLFLDVPPDTSAYMIAAYIVFFLVAAIYVLSLVIRWRNLDQERKILQQMEAKDQSSSAQVTKK